MLGLSRSQEIVWLHEELFPDSRAYNFTAVLNLRGPLDEPALRRSLAVVLDRHAGFRLELVPGTFPPQQRVCSNYQLRYHQLDFRERADQEAAFDALWREQHDEPFDTAEAPLVRWTLVRLDDDYHRLIQTEHHLVHDGWSFSLVLRDLFITYRAITQNMPAELPVPRSYVDHIRESLPAQASSEGRKKSLAFWREALNGAVFDLPLPGQVPSDRRRYVPEGEQSRQQIDVDLARRLRESARRDGHTPFSVLLGLFAELLRRQSGRKDLVIGSAVGNRPPGFGETVGMFVNTIPLRLRLEPHSSAVEAMDEVTEVLIRSLPYQDVPIQDLARELGVHSNGGLENPLFRVMFSAHDAPLPHIQELGLEVTIQEAYNTGTSRFDLDVVLIPDSERTVNSRDQQGGMILVWDYASDLFNAKHIEALQERLVAMLADYLDGSDRPLAALAATAGH